ncbi:tripartite motif-containing protein 2-like [Argopecten irradians]|uniref:tripartite motif-containing protein 2-like n=1 Tax=Argopecten irradians TaxID=31199 RepID=UPI0037169F26
MVDYLSRYRLYGHGYTSPEQRYPITTYREIYRDSAPHIFGRRPRSHDCRMDTMKDLTEKKDWEAWMFSHGLGQVYRSVNYLHNQEKEVTPQGTAAPDKLLFNIGMKGRGDGDFHYPRGLSVTLDGEILVADTMNHRIQIFNQYGIFIKKIGTKGNGEGQFDQPTDVTELPNGDLAVADKKNKRVQIFSQRRQFKYMFPTGDEPFSIASDKDYNIIVSTIRRSIEVYRRGGKLVHAFSVGGSARDKIGCHICVNTKEEVIVCDAVNNSVKYFTYGGKPLYKFSPISTGEGLSMLPSGICINMLGEVIIGDALNHTVNLYSERGVLLKQLVGPSDEAGAVQTCAIGPEGHLMVTEFSVSGPHSLKIFRYKQCYCHLTRPGSSKRRTPTKME